MAGIRIVQERSWVWSQRNHRSCSRERVGHILSEGSVWQQQGIKHGQKAHRSPAPLDDVSLCIEYGVFSIVDEAAPGRLRPPDDTERLEIAESIECAMLRTAWISVTQPASLMTLEERGRGS
jgi:hypothetical protein